MITLTTDFGNSDSYVAQMKGAILSVNPHVQVIDVTHEVPRQDVARGAMILEEIAPVFPDGTIHVAVVDPGVGSARAIVAAEAAGQRFLAPDNGLLGLVLARAPAARIHRVRCEWFWRAPVSATFHGRDIFAPVAAHWSLGTDVAEFGPVLAREALVQLPSTVPQLSGSELIGRIEAVDSFGNLITNIQESHLGTMDRGSVQVIVAGRQITGISRCYSEQPAGALLALIGSSGKLEIGVNAGSAARVLGANTGTEVRVK